MNFSLFILLLSVALVTMSAQVVSERSKKLSQLFHNAVTDQKHLDTPMAKKILSQFKADDTLVSTIGESVPILHHLLNIFRLTSNERTKFDLLEIMETCMQLGADASHAYNQDPPLLFKLLLLKELHIARQAVHHSPKAALDLIMGNGRWSAGFFSILYAVPSESVPLVKLLLYADTTVRAKGLAAMGGVEGLKKLLSGAVLGKPTVRPGDIDRYSSTYHEVVTSLGGERGQLRLLDMISCLDETAAAVHQVLLDVVLGLAGADLRDEVALQLVRLLTASHATATAQTASPYGRARNALHYLGLSGSKVLWQQLGRFIEALEQGNTEVVSDGTTAPLRPSPVHATCVQLLRDAFTATDARGHTPISYCAMRFSPQSPAFAALSEFAAAVGVSVAAALADAVDAGVLRQPSPQAQRSDSSSTQELQVLDNGGWDTSRLPVLSDAAGASPVDHRITEVFAPTLPANKEFFQKYINTGTPVVFRQVVDPAVSVSPAASTSALRAVLKKDAFLQRYGNFSVPAATIPYAGNHSSFVALDILIAFVTVPCPSAVRYLRCSATYVDDGRCGQFRKPVLRRATRRRASVHLLHPGPAVGAAATTGCPCAALHRQGHYLVRGQRGGRSRPQHGFLEL
jgi:hypothetical protein